METKVKMIKRVEQGDKIVDISYSYNKELAARRPDGNWRPRDRTNRDKRKRSN